MPVTKPLGHNANRPAAISFVPGQGVTLAITSGCRAGNLQPSPWGMPQAPAVAMTTSAIGRQLTRRLRVRQGGLSRSDAAIQRKIAHRGPARKAAQLGETALGENAESHTLAQTRSMDEASWAGRIQLAQSLPQFGQRNRYGLPAPISGLAAASAESRTFTSRTTERASLGWTSRAKPSRSFSPSPPVWCFC